MPPEPRTYTPSEIGAAMLAAGFDPSKIREGVAIVFAESGGRSNATNYNPGVENSVGPFQINLLAHPDINEECARDLDCSTAKAFNMSGGGASWTPWGAWTNGSYAKYLGLWSESANPPPTSSGGGSTGGHATAPAATDTGYSCGLDQVTILAIGDYLKTMTPQQVADLLTRNLGRQITVECMRHDAYGASDEVGKQIDALTQIPVLGGAAEIAASGIKTWADLGKSENLWRVGFLALGAILVFVGTRIYLGAPEPVRAPEVAT